jgi:hypothetical protein
MPPREVSYFFEGVGALFPINNPSISFCSHQVPKIFPSNSSCSHQIPKNSHQIPLVFINNPSISFHSHQVPKQFPSSSSSSHQVPIKFVLFPSCSHQNPFVPMAMEDRQVSTTVNGETHEDSSRLLNMGRPKGEP